MGNWPRIKSFEVKERKNFSLKLVEIKDSRLAQISCCSVATVSRKRRSIHTKKE